MVANKTCMYFKIENLFIYRFCITSNKETLGVLFCVWLIQKVDYPFLVNI